MANSKPHRLRATEKESLRKLLVDRRAILSGDAASIEKEALNGDGNGGELSNVPFHMADVGSENYEREFSLGLLENENEEMREIDEALTRLEDGTYGTCEACEKSIPLARLRALPYARMCVECKTNQENGKT